MKVLFLRGRQLIALKRPWEVTKDFVVIPRRRMASAWSSLNLLLLVLMKTISFLQLVSPWIFCWIRIWIIPSLPTSRAVVIPLLATYQQIFSTQSSQKRIFRFGSRDSWGFLAQLDVLRQSLDSFEHKIINFFARNTFPSNLLQTRELLDNEDAIRGGLLPLVPISSRQVSGWSDLHLGSLGPARSGEAEPSSSDWPLLVLTNSHVRMAAAGDDSRTTHGWRVSFNARFRLDRRVRFLCKIHENFYECCRRPLRCFRIEIIYD